MRGERRSATMMLTAPPDGRSSARCHRRGVLLDSCQLPTRKCGLPAHHGSAGRYLWSSIHVLWISGSLHNWERCLRNCSHRTRYARRPNNPGPRRWRYTERELDHLIGPRTTIAEVNVSRLHTTGIFFRHIPCTDYWRLSDQNTMEMVSSPAVVWRSYTDADVAQGSSTSIFHSVP